jgi:hypothetical protein
MLDAGVRVKANSEHVYTGFIGVFPAGILAWSSVFVDAVLQTSILDHVDSIVIISQPEQPLHFM